MSDEQNFKKETKLSDGDVVSFKASDDRWIITVIEVTGPGEYGFGMISKENVTVNPDGIILTSEEGRKYLVKVKADGKFTRLSISMNCKDPSSLPTNAEGFAPGGNNRRSKPSPLSYNGFGRAPR